MTITVIMLFAILIGSVAVTAQENVRHAPREQELIDLSDAKWKWMAEKDVEQLDSLFHDSAQFVHMGGYWDKEAELNTINAGAIWYKHAEIHKQEVQFAGPTATVYSTIHLNSVVGGCVSRSTSRKPTSARAANGNYSRLCSQKTSANNSAVYACIFSAFPSKNGVSATTCRHTGNPHTFPFVMNI